MPLFIFLSYLSAGLLVSLAVTRLGKEGQQFFLFNAGMAWIFGALALVLRLAGSTAAAFRPDLPTSVIGGAALLAIAAYLLRGALGNVSSSLLRVGAALSALALLLDARSLHAGAAAGPLPAGQALHILNAATSAWLAGSILLAMVLGHFYLVIPRLSIAPLRSLFRFSLVGLAARIALVGVAGLLWWMDGGSSSFTITTFLTQGVFVLQRVLFGLLIPASLAYFTYKTIEMRSTQSATGILYVVVFLTLVGEALSVYLSLETTIPI